MQNNIKKLRMQKGIYKQKDFADLVGSSASWISQWETGKATPSLKYINRLKEILNCTYEELFNHDQNESLPSGSFEDKTEEALGV